MQLVRVRDTYLREATPPAPILNSNMEEGRNRLGRAAPVFEHQTGGAEKGGRRTALSCPCGAAARASGWRSASSNFRRLINGYALA